MLLAHLQGWVEGHPLLAQLHVDLKQRRDALLQQRSQGRRPALGGTGLNAPHSRWAPPGGGLSPLGPVAPGASGMEPDARPLGQKGLERPRAGQDRTGQRLECRLTTWVRGLYLLLTSQVAPTSQFPRIQKRRKTACPCVSGLLRGLDESRTHRACRVAAGSPLSAGGRGHGVCGAQSHPGWSPLLGRPRKEKLSCPPEAPAEKTRALGGPVCPRTPLGSLPGRQCRPHRRVTGGALDLSSHQEAAAVVSAHPHLAARQAGSQPISGMAG